MFGPLIMQKNWKEIKDNKSRGKKKRKERKFNLLHCVWIDK